MKEKYKNIDGMFSVEGEPEIVEDIRATILSKFNDLKFFEGPHIYTLHEQRLKSVTTKINEYVSPKDWDTIAENYALKYGKTKKYWQDAWKFNNLKSTISGTLIHAYGESLGYLKNGHPEKITPDNICKYDKERNWLIPTRGKEEAALKFYNELYKDLHFILAEAKMFTEGLKENLAGTADILFYYDDPKGKNSGVCVYDWKTNAALEKKAAHDFHNMLLPPFDDMYEEPLSEYKIQLNTYSIPLQDLGLKIIARRVVWLKDNGTYKIVPIPDMIDRVRQTL